MHFLTHKLNGLFEAILFQKADGAAAGDCGEKVGEIRFLQAGQFTDCIEDVAWTEISRCGASVRIGALGCTASA